MKKYEYLIYWFGLSALNIIVATIIDGPVTEIQVYANIAVSFGATLIVLLSDLIKAIKE